MGAEHEREAWRRLVQVVHEADTEALEAATTSSLCTTACTQTTGGRWSTTIHASDFTADSTPAQKPRGSASTTWGLIRDNMLN